MNKADELGQDNLRERLDAAVDLLDGGATLGDISAMASTAKADALIAAVDAMGAKGGKGTSFVDFAFALMYWVREVEARLQAMTISGRNSPAQDAVGSSESERGQSSRVGDAPAARSALPQDEPSMRLHCGGCDMNHDADSAFVLGEMCPMCGWELVPFVATATPATEPEACSKCKTTLECRGVWRTCTKCNQSWKVPERVRPLESPKAATFATCAIEQSVDVALHGEYLTFHDRDTGQSVTVSEQAVREALQVEPPVKRAPLAQSAWVPDERPENQHPARRDMVVMWIRSIVSSLEHLDFERTRAAALELRDSLRLAPDRIEFSVKEVLP